MGNRSLTQLLVFSHEQLQAFVEFKNAGSDFFYKHNSSITQHERWGKACVSVTFILVAAYSSSTIEHHFTLTNEHADSLRDMLKLVDDLSTNFSSTAAESLYKKMLSSLAMFRGAIEHAITTTKPKK